MANWTVRTYYKKSIEEHEHFSKDGMDCVRRTGWRSGSWSVTTTDDNQPAFEFDYVPGGDGKRDSINMYDCPGENIEDVELIETWDGCWEDIDFNNMDVDEAERLQELIDEDGFYEVMEEQEGWLQGDTEMWIWGPIEILDKDGNSARIICADENGNVVDFKDE